MMDLAESLSFLLEALGEFLVTCITFVKHFDGNGLSEADMATPIDRGHAAYADPLLDSIPASNRNPQ
jgi:hypothetical protein